MQVTCSFLCLGIKKKDKRPAKSQNHEDTEYVLDPKPRPLTLGKNFML